MVAKYLRTSLDQGTKKIRLEAIKADNIICPIKIRGSSF